MGNTGNIDNYLELGINKYPVIWEIVTFLERKQELGNRAFNFGNRKWAFYFLELGFGTPPFCVYSVDVVGFF